MSLSIQLVALSGPLRGESWVVGEAPLVLGRDLNCDIRLYSPPASRKHCVVKKNGDGLQLDEVNARNPVFVNGRPVHQTTLHVADTLAIGDDVFLVSLARPLSMETATSPNQGDTVSYGELLSARWDERPKNRRTTLPTTAEQLIFLFETTRELSTCTSRASALQVLTQRLQDCFRPDTIWIVRKPPNRGKVHFQRIGGEDPSSGNPPSSKVVRAVLSTGQGTLTRHSAPGNDSGILFSSLVAPIHVTGVTLGAIVLQRAPDSAAYDPEDSSFLDVIARASAPFLHMAETIGHLEMENIRLRRCVGEPGELVGKSRIMAELRQELEKAAPTELNVILRGETGTGKEVAARILHTHSHRHNGPFVVINCAAIPSELFESQVFGYCAGAFTGAQKPHEGLFVQADGGTLFLDEVADLSLENQARILRAVELGTFRSLGSAEEIYVDARIVAATNKDLHLLIRQGSFREDFYHRLNGYEVMLPPLRQRKEDIPLLAQYFVDIAEDTGNHLVNGLSDEALNVLTQRPWPGNVRELRNTIFRAVGTARAPLIQPEDLGLDSLSTLSAPEDDGLDAWEKQHIATVLARHGGNVQEAAKALGIARSTLYKKLAAHGLTI